MKTMFFRKYFLKYSEKNFYILCMYLNFQIYYKGFMIVALKKFTNFNQNILCMYFHNLSKNKKFKKQYNKIHYNNVMIR